jgi:hypothetical protein
VVRFLVVLRLAKSNGNGNLLIDSARELLTANVVGVRNVDRVTTGSA